MKKQLEISEEGQRTERFAKAIELLGENEIQSIRGGIYALERLARDSERDHWPIMEVLTAYVREKSPWPPGARGITSRDEATRQEDTLLVREALTVLGRRSHIDKEATEERGLNLISTDFLKAYLENANFSNANFAQSNLYRTVLWRSNLSHANCYKALMDTILLVDAEIENTNLRRASLRGANLTRGSFEGAIFGNTDLTGANLTEAHMDGVRFKESNLERASFEGAHLRGTEFHGCSLAGARFRKADLRGASFMGVPNWREIAALDSSNVYGVQAPPGFHEWAVDTMGAISVATDSEWERVLAESVQ
jgi:uncharacterized protein YjbI with pentapeptide repeats